MATKIAYAKNKSQMTPKTRKVSTSKSVISYAYCDHPTSTKSLAQKKKKKKKNSNNKLIINK